MYKIYYMGHLIPDNYLRNRRKRCMVKNKKWHIKKIAALAGAVVLAVSSAALYAAPQVKAANGPCDTGDWAYAYINVKIGEEDRKSTRLNSSHNNQSRMPSSA